MFPSPYIVNNDGKRTYLQLEQGGVLGYTAGAGINISLLRVISATAVTNSVTVLPTAYSLGIAFGGSTDQTSALNTAFSNVNYSGITVDGAAPNFIYITGTVNAQGKLLKVQPNMYFTGGGTINNAVIDGYDYAQLFDTSITLTNCKSAKDHTSAMWFGATGNGSTDDQPALQKHTDTIIANLQMPRKVIVPFCFTSYKINSPWNLWNWNGTAYQQWNLEIVGAESLPSSYVTNFPQLNAASITTTFAIGVQRGYGSTINGLAIQGAFTTSMTYDTFINSSFATAAPTLRDSPQSPNAGIVIDPFSNSSSNIPADGGYPGLTSYYRGTGGGGGSTGITIKNCVIKGFTVDICNSPNSFTQQGEDCLIDNCQLEYCKVAIAYCQSQSDRCYIKNGRSWYYIWTVIDCYSYGAANGYCGNIDGYNVAGYVNTLFNIGAFKTLSINNFYAESFFQIGVIQGNTVVNASTFNFYVTDLNVNPQYNITKHIGVIYNSCIFRYYDNLYNKRMRIGVETNITYNDCLFDLPPYVCTPSYTSQYPSAQYNNCTVKANLILGQGNTTYVWQAANVRPVLFGRFTIQDYIGLDSTDGGAGVYTPVNSTVTWDFNCTEINRYIRSGVVAGGGVAITPVNGVATGITANTSICQVNDILREHVNGDVVGRISAVDTVAGTINLAEIPINITAGTYNLELVYFAFFETPFLGDITVGSPNVTNVLNVFPNPPVSGQRGDFPGFALGTYIVSVSGSTVVMSTNAQGTGTKAAFINGNPQITVTSGYAPNDTIFVTGSVPYTKAFPAGTIWIQQSKWYFNTGGTLSGSTVADYNIQYVTRIVGGLQQQYYDPSLSTWVNI